MSVAEGAPADVVAAAADGDEQIVRTREFHGVHDIGRAGAAGDEAGVLVDARVPNLAGLVVAGFAGLDDGAVEGLRELLDGGGVDGSAVALLQSMVSHGAPRWFPVRRIRSGEHISRS